MNILYIAQAYHPRSSASITTEGIVKGLVEKGHSVDLLVAVSCLPKCPPDCAFGCNKTERITVRRSPIPSLASFEKHMSLRVFAFTLSYFFIIIHALLIARKRKFDAIIVMYHATHLAPFSALLISNFTKAPLLIKCHDVVSTEARWGSLEQVFSTVTSRMNLFALKKARKILALSDELAFLIKKLYNVPAERFAIIPNGVDTKMFDVNEKGHTTRERSGLVGKKVMLYMGSLNPPYRKKGLEFLIQAMPRVKEKEPNIVLVTVGEASGRVREDLETLSSSLKVKKSLKFMESVPHEEMPAYISMADICIGPLCPSLETYGSTPRKVLEYLACAKPVIVCKGGVSSDLIRNAQNGLLVNYGDLEELETNILKLLRDPTFAKKLGQKARQHIIASYDENVVTDRLNSEIQKLYP